MVDQHRNHSRRQDQAESEGNGDGLKGAPEPGRPRDGTREPVCLEIEVAFDHASEVPLSFQDIYYSGSRRLTRVLSCVPASL